ncbi:MAG: molybdenum cofactor biosynthesis protein MoaE [Candidatus Sericytochromatia bacterium]
MFKISDEKIEKLSLYEYLINPSAGASVVFEGLVRNHNEGKEVLQLEYEAFERMCEKEAKKIFDEAKEQFKIFDIVCIHRVGKLEIGDIAVWLGVNSAHRGDSFKACEYVIDNIKTRLPIWKKEYYRNGDSGWVNCEQCSSHNHKHHSHK